MGLVLILVWVLVIALGCIYEYKTTNSATKVLESWGMDDGDDPLVLIYNYLLIPSIAILLSSLAWYFLGIGYAIGVAVLVFMAFPLYELFFLLLKLLSYLIIDPLIDNLFKVLAVIVALSLIAIFFDENIARYILIVLVVLFVGYKAYAYCDGKKCPKCNACVKYPFSRVLISSYYRYKTKSGQPDKRFKNNLLTNRYRYSYRCAKKDCNNEFTIDSTNNYIEVREP